MVNFIIVRARKKSYLGLSKTRDGARKRQLFQESRERQSTKNKKE
jgi:hypothetical protein